MKTKWFDEWHKHNKFALLCIPIYGILNSIWTYGVVKCNLHKQIDELWYKNQESHKGHSSLLN